MKGLLKLSRIDWIFYAVGLLLLAVLYWHPLTSALGLAMMGLGRPILTQQDLDQHRTALATQDIIYAPIYDSAS